MYNVYIYAYIVYYYFNAQYLCVYVATYMFVWLILGYLFFHYIIGL